MVQAEKIRNLAIIAHIDHGKTTLIDSIFKAAQIFRKGAHIEERVMDSNELERERGITIRAKHCTVEWNGYLINIIDTRDTLTFLEKWNASSQQLILSFCSSMPTKGPCPRHDMYS